jgi:hypothetical protein
MLASAVLAGILARSLQQRRLQQRRLQQRRLQQRRLVVCNVQKLGLLAFKGQAILPVFSAPFRRARVPVLPQNSILTRRLVTI